MQTHFSAEQLADPHVASLEKILRSCVHCGFCTATCPTYVVDRDERDSPRGRIYLIKELLETGRPPDSHDVEPLDHCLSCLSCMTTCPSGVDYRRLIDHARVEVETRYARAPVDRVLRTLLVWLLPHRGRFRLAMGLANLGKPFLPILARLPEIGPQLEAMLRLAPARLPARDATEGPGVFKAPAATAKRRRVALLTGCAQAVLAPQINAATIRVLNRAGIDVVLPKGEGCCGSLAHHMGREGPALAAARANIDAWMREIDGEGLDAILVTASGCGATIKDYGAMLADDPAYAGKAARVAGLAKDPSEYLIALDLTFAAPRGNRVAYHPACSLQHGQKIIDAPKRLLTQAGFEVVTPAEAHLCCGSAGVYNILQPRIASALRDRKVRNLQRLRPDVIATGNIGCMTQIGSATQTPVAHTVELVDWAQGGPAPFAIGDEDRLRAG
jgi:glycolate oxidase iron-sulfur subunit